MDVDAENDAKQSDSGDSFVSVLLQGRVGHPGPGVLAVQHVPEVPIEARGHLLEAERVDVHLLLVPLQMLVGVPGEAGGGAAPGPAAAQGHPNKNMERGGNVRGETAAAAEETCQEAPHLNMV